jgi:hypothetical protein
MNQDILDQNNLADEETEKNPTVDKEDKRTESSSSEDKAPPPNKKGNQVFYHQCTNLIKKTVTMTMKKLNKWIILTMKKIMMIKKKLKLVN